MCVSGCPVNCGYGSSGARRTRVLRLSGRSGGRTRAGFVHRTARLPAPHRTTHHSIDRPVTKSLRSRIAASGRSREDSRLQYRESAAGTRNRRRRADWKPRGGFEPPTGRLQIDCSGQLSYRGTWGQNYVRDTDEITSLIPRRERAARFAEARRDVHRRRHFCVVLPNSRP